LAHCFHPHLTAVAQPASEMGYQGATLLMDRVEGKRTGEPVVMRLAPELRIRESTRDHRPPSGEEKTRERRRSGSARGKQR